MIDRRSFIRRSLMLAGLAILKPAELLSHIPKIDKVVTSSRIDAWRQHILDLYPDTRASLTKLLKDDAQFDWWTE